MYKLIWNSESSLAINLPCNWEILTTSKVYEY